MKKLVLLLAVAFSASLFSCGGNDKNAEADTTAVDTTVVVEEAVVMTDSVDSVATDTTVADSAAAQE